MHHFDEGEEYWDSSKVTGLTSDWLGWASHWPQLSAFVQLSSHHPWQGIREHILPMYLLLSSHQETDYKNPQKTLHIYISVCHNSLGLGPSFYKSHRNLFSWCRPNTFSARKELSGSLIGLSELTLNSHYAFLSVLRDYKRRRITNFLSTHLCQFKFIKCRKVKTPRSRELSVFRRRVNIVKGKLNYSLLPQRLMQHS